MVSVCDCRTDAGSRWVSAVVAAGAADAVLPESCAFELPQATARNVVKLSDVPRTARRNGDVVRTIPSLKTDPLSMGGALPADPPALRGGRSFRYLRWATRLSSTGPRP